MIGTDFAGYQLIKKLGGGNTGIVFKAYDPKARNYLALKILPNDFLVSQERRARFTRETRAASLLSHPAIARMLQVGSSEDGHNFIAMEYVDGSSYREIIDELKDGADEGQFYKLLLPVLEGMAYAHKNHLVHRDLKPENLKLTSEDQPKILDFGLVKFLDKEPSGEDSFQTMAGMVLGSAGYMSPEQADGLSTDMRTDIFSVGVIMYEVLSGKNPFQCKNPFATITKILTANPISLELLRPDIPVPLCQLVQRCLSKDLDKRYDNAAALLDAVRGVKGTQ